MKVRKKMSENVRNKIKEYIKNNLDISDLIEDYDIKGEYLAGATIKRFNRINEDLQNINFVRCTIGEDGKITNLSGSNLKGSNFQRTTFLGKTWFKGCDLRNTNFNDAWMPFVEYQYADLRNITLCNAFIRIGSRSGFKAKFEWKLFELLSQYLNLDVQK